MSIYTKNFELMLIIPAFTYFGIMSNLFEDWHGIGNKNTLLIVINVFIAPLLIILYSIYLKYHHYQNVENAQRIFDAVTYIFVYFFVGIIIDDKPKSKNSAKLKPKEVKKTAAPVETPIDTSSSEEGD